ncbi:MAG TPA: hypothetical protein VJ692_15205 [Nitrospiraceae bacterium]|nr:hypothetical protein [Nitrospiraceae bacterium]
MIPHLGSLLMITLLAACATGPDPVVIYESPREAVRVAFDPQSGTGHSHPAAITPDQMAKILQGVRVSQRNTFGLGGLFGQNEEAPAFSTSEIAVLASPLSRALAMASPKDLATFYATSYDPKLGKLVTSGGLFVRHQRVYIMVANSRTPPSAGPYEGTAYELDNRNEPLTPIARYRFSVGFVPEDARLPLDQAGAEDGYTRRYVDKSKLLVIDLLRLPAATADRRSSPNDPREPEVQRNAQGNVKREGNAQ